MLFEMGAENLIGVKQEEAKVEDCDKRDIYDIWDVTIEDVERIRLLLTPAVHTLLEFDPVVQLYVPLIPFPDEVKVVRQEELLEEFGDEILNITVVDEEADINLTKEIKELERLIATDHESSFTKIKNYALVLVILAAIQVDARRVVLGWLLAAWKPFKLD
uniref:Uncharacterized protein n=1 Tax=Tanacetum cinerariifolium TaxID=118510 RepID=A0A6L2LLN9_TANCI|nr:hypothetical protein [Tanacetum cinerariifolium]